VARVVLTASADSDTAYILADLAAKAGASVAARYAGDFDAVYRRLEQFPGSGSPRRAYGSLLCIGVVSPYTIYHEYSEAEDVVTIMRIVHGHRRFTRRMLNRPTTRP